MDEEEEVQPTGEVRVDPEGKGLPKGCWLSCATAEMRQLREPYKRTDPTKENNFSFVGNLVTSNANISSGHPTFLTLACVATPPPGLGKAIVGGTEEEEEVKGHGGHRPIVETMMRMWGQEEGRRELLQHVACVERWGTPNVPVPLITKYITFIIIS